MKVINKRGSEQLGMEAGRLYDEVMTLKTAIEEAIMKGQKSVGGLSDIPKSGPVSNEDFALTSVNASSGTACQTDDF